MAEALFVRALDRRGASLTVGSRGLLPGGVPVPDQVVDTLRQRGIDLPTQVSRQVDAGSLGDARLIVTMTRQHLVSLAADCPGVWAKTFQLSDLVRRADERGGRRSTEGLETWVGRMHVGRTARSALVATAADDIPDPMGQRRSAYEKVAQLLERLVEPLAAAVTGAASVPA